MRPLDGITVVTLEHAIAAPFCTRQLADLGARVIKVERPGSGDFARLRRARARHGLALRLEQPLEGKPDARCEACAGAEVLAQVARAGRRPGAEPGARRRRAAGPVPRGAARQAPAADRLRHLRLRRRRPVPRQESLRPADPERVGFLSITGSPDEPAKAGCSIADIAAGMYAYRSILAALLQRGRTGQGCRIDVSMLESMVEWMGYPLYYAFDGATPPPRAGAAHATIYPVRPVPCRRRQDGHARAAERARMGRLLPHVLRRPELAADERFASNSRRASRSARRCAPSSSTPSRRSAPNT